MKQENELVLLAPIQVKEYLSLGNIYDLTVADFYAKVKQAEGVKVAMPVIWNVNGKHLEKIAKAKNSAFKDTADKLTKNLQANFPRLFLTSFTSFVRDDLIGEELKQLLEGKYRDKFIHGKTDVNICPRCGYIYGSDPQSFICRNCGNPTGLKKRDTFFVELEYQKMRKAAHQISFKPPSAYTRLLDFVSQQEERDCRKLVVEKNREYTVRLNDKGLDPKFVSIMTIALLEPENFDRITFIQGDVIKKFDYYALAFLNWECLPDKIFVHGLVTDKNGLKLRHQNNQTEILGDVKMRELRAHFLRHNISKNIVIDPATIFHDTRDLVNLYLMTKRILEPRNLSEDSGEMLEDAILSQFLKEATKLNLPAAFRIANDFIHGCWKILKTRTLKQDEYQLVKWFQTLYFGEETV